MSKRRKLLLTAGSLVALVSLGLVLFFVQSNDSKDSSSADQTTKPTDPIVSLDMSRDMTIKKKKACDLLDSQLAAKTIGEGAVKNDKLTAINTADYSSTSCEYTLGNKKANITLYEYKTAEKAAAEKTNLQNQALLPGPDGRTAKVQPKQAAVVVKDKYAITASVSAGGSFDGGNSSKLSEEALSKL